MLYIIDFFIYIFCYIFVVLLRYGKIDITSFNQVFLLSFIFYGGISSLITRKISKLQKGKEAYKPFFYSFILMLGFLSFTSVWFRHLEGSRVLIIGSLSLSFILELVLVTLFIKSKRIKYDKIKEKIIFSEFIFNLLILLLSFIIVEWIGSNKLLNYHGYYFFYFGFILCWYISSKLTHNYILNLKQNYWRFIWDYFTSFILLSASTFFIIFILELSFKNIISIIYSLSTYFILYFIIITLRYLNRKEKVTDEVETKVFKSTHLLDIEEIEKKLNHSSRNIILEINDKSDNLINKFKNIYLKDFPKIFERINLKINLSNFSSDKVLVLKSCDIYNVQIQENNTLDFFINLHELNDIRRINAFFIEVNKKLTKTGLFLGRFEPIKNRYTRFMVKFPYILAKTFYFFDFIWKRVIPKLPVLQKVYFALTDGKDRALSFAETLGRLYYCGFEIIDLYEPDNFVYFIAKKMKEPSIDRNPSYGPLFKMKRIGKNGKAIYVYKFRTMHPYSEYLQEFTFNVLGSSTGDKVDNDFRISYWGRFLRKLWIDEIPMFFNLFKGELKLVGVRPLSLHKFNMYPEEAQKRRIKYKPGLVPPFYYDLPKNFEELILSERNYLEKYEKNPIRTDIEYFFKAWYNIIVKKARSG